MGQRFRPLLIRILLRLFTYQEKEYTHENCIGLYPTGINPVF